MPKEKKIQGVITEKGKSGDKPSVRKTAVRKSLKPTVKAGRTQGGSAVKAVKKSDAVKGKIEPAARRRKNLASGRGMKTKVSAPRSKVVVPEANKMPAAEKTISNKTKLMQSENPQEETVTEPAAAGEENRTFVKWTGKNFLRSREERLFYKVSLIAALMVVIWSVLDGNWLTTVTFLTASVIMLFELRDEPRDVEYEISIDGILIDGKLYKFDDINSFDIAKKGNFDIVKLQLRNSFFPIREIHLAEGQDLVYIETLLEYFLPHETQEDMLFNFSKRGGEASADKEGDMAEPTVPKR